MVTHSLAGARHRRQHDCRGISITLLSSMLVGEKTKVPSQAGTRPTMFENDFTQHCSTSQDKVLPSTRSQNGRPLRSLATSSSFSSVSLCPHTRLRPTLNNCGYCCAAELDEDSSTDSFTRTYQSVRIVTSPRRPVEANTRDSLYSLPCEASVRPSSSRRCPPHTNTYTELPWSRHGW